MLSCCEMGNGGELGSSFGCPVEQPPREALAMFFRCCCNPNDRTLYVLLGLDYRVTDQLTSCICQDQVLLGLHPRVFKLESQTLDAFRPLPVTVRPDISKQPGQRAGVGPLKVA